MGRREDGGASEERVVAVCLSLSARRRPWGQREQGLREVRGEVQEPSGRLREGGGEDGGLVEQREGQRRAVMQHVRRQRRGGARPHLVEGEARLVAVERVGGRRCAQAWSTNIVKVHLNQDKYFTPAVFMRSHYLRGRGCSASCREAWEVSECLN